MRLLKLLRGEPASQPKVSVSGTRISKAKKSRIPKAKKVLQHSFSILFSKKVVFMPHQKV